MISLFSMDEPVDKQRSKSIFNYKKPAFWIIFALAMIITAAAIVFLPNIIKRTSDAIIPADVKLFEMKIKDYSMEQYIADFKSGGEMQYHWITDMPEFNAFYLSMFNHFKNNEDVSILFRKYNSDFFRTNCLVIITLRSDSNITCIYNGDYKAKNLISFPNKKGVTSTYEFAYGNLLPAFSLEYLWLKNGSEKTDQSNWWLSFIEFNNDDFDINPSVISPTVVFRENNGNTDEVSAPSEPVIPVVLSSAERVSTDSTVSTDNFFFPESFEENGKYGAIDDNGIVIVPAQYDYLTADYFFRDSMNLYVLLNNQWGAITLDSCMNASAPDWSSQIPEDIMIIYSYFTKPVYAATDFEAKITEMFSHSGSFDFLASETGEISDEQMVVYAAHNMPNYDWENGNTRAEFESVTMKYFGKTLSDYTVNDWFEYIPGTDRLVPTGWSIGDQPDWVLLSSSLKKEGDVYTGIFDCYYISLVWDDATAPWDKAEQFFQNRDWKPFFENGCAIDTLEIKFSLGQEKDGSYYPIYHSVKYISQFNY